MLLDLNRPQNPLDGGDHTPSSHYHQPDIYPTDFASSNLNPVPLIQCLFDSQPIMSYDFQEPNQLFTNRLPPQLLRATSLSCHSSNSLNRSHLNPHQQMSVSNHDCHSPASLPQSYLTTSIDFIQSFASPKNSYVDFLSREGRSESTISDQNSNWKATLNNADGSLGPIQWGEQASDWKFTKFGLDRGHIRSRSVEGTVHGSPFQPEQCRSYFELNGTGDYLDPNAMEFHSLQQRTPVPIWTPDSSSTDGGSPFDETASAFGLGTFPTDNNIRDKFVSNSTPEGPVMAEFPLPPKLSERDSNTPAPKRQRGQRSETQTVVETGSTVGSVAANKKIKKSAPRSSRPNNNGGRCRRLAPANRECPHCGDKFTRNDRLNYHIDSIHEQKERKYKCVECAKAFRQRCDLQRHMRHVHKFTIRKI